VCFSLYLSFFCNECIAVSQFCSYYTAVSGTSLFESWVYTGFNFILGLPIIFFGFLDRDLSEEFMLKYPQVNTMRICFFYRAHAIPFQYDSF